MKLFEHLSAGVPFIEEECIQKKDHYKKVLNLMITICIMLGITFLSFAFRFIGFHESNIIVTYILGVLLVAKQTDGYFYGIVASVIGVLTFNFFFTEPYYTFYVHRADYPVTFAIMLIAAMITSTLTVKVKREAMLSYSREQKTQLLYKINKNLLQVRTMTQIAEVGGRDIGKLFSRTVLIATTNPDDTNYEPYIYAHHNDERGELLKSNDEIMAITKAFQTGEAVGAGTHVFSNCVAYYFPIIGHGNVLGIVGIACFNHQYLSEEQIKLLETVTTQIALAIERERLWEKQQKSKLDVERERIKGNLLRAISHDLRTPLTSILGATSTILDNDHIIDGEVKRELLQNIYEDTSWLIHTVENILSITRIDDGRIEIVKNMEAIEEIVGEAVSRIKKLSTNHTIKINIPDDLILIPMDGMLIEQVLINLIDNAIKYTPYESTIEVKVYLINNKVVFEVSDDGEGIKEENKEVIFNRFYSNALGNDTEKRGTGLGLAICKSIITAHGGEISVFNNFSGGATFRFILESEE
ncbi:MAG: histidine kinase [Firmicutes bacterium HGW-Firmicutes-1]|nr:MAG: histidine kinase [Firmicutes bacterium HGW-Firmicutes-1]